MVGEQKSLQSECIEWPGCRNPYGYGQVFRNGKRMMAHRVVWADRNGPIPAGMCICHHCDNPPCVNPDHLFIGTQKDNIQDASKKGRLKGNPFGNPFKPGDQLGLKNSNCKLSDDAIKCIRTIHRGGNLRQKDIGRLFGISQAYVGKLARGMNR